MSSVMDAKQWASDLASVRDWAFEAQPNSYLNGRVASMSIGKVLRGGSSINAMAWARGHQNDWDYFAAEAGDSASNYEAVVDGNLKVYGIQNLRIADASIMPRVTTGNTMAPTSSSANEQERSCGGYISYEPTSIPSSGVMGAISPVMPSIINLCLDETCVHYVIFAERYLL